MFNGKLEKYIHKLEAKENIAIKHLKRADGREMIAILDNKSSYLTSTYLSAEALEDIEILKETIVNQVEVLKEMITSEKMYGVKGKNNEVHQLGQLTA